MDPLRFYKVVPIDGAKKKVEVGFSLVGTVELTAGHIANPADMQDQVLRDLRDLIDMELSERVIEPHSESSGGTGQDQEARPSPGGPDRSNVQGESRGPEPVGREASNGVVHPAAPATNGSGTQAQ